MSVSQSEVPHRAVPVFAERGGRRRVMGATDWWFYPLILACAAGLILASVGADALPRKPAAQGAAHDGAALVYGPHALARAVRVDKDHVLFVVRDFGVSARAIRVAVRPNTEAPTAQDTGAQILLDPADTAPLAGKAVDVTLQVRRFTVTAAGGIAVSLQNGGASAWTTTPLPPTSGPVTVRVQAPPGAPPTALGVRMLTDRADFNYGAEITRVTLSPAS